MCATVSEGQVRDPQRRTCVSQPTPTCSNNGVDDNGDGQVDERGTTGTQGPRRDNPENLASLEVAMTRWRWALDVQ
jgi:hypothetical protein